MIVQLKVDTKELKRIHSQVSAKSRPVINAASRPFIKTHRVLDAPHQQLANHLSWYDKWHHTKYHRHIHVGVLAAYLLFLLINSGANAAGSWIQTDWSGGVGTSTANQYSSSSNIDASTSPGNLSLSITSSWYNASWAYRRKITFDNTTASLGTTSEALVNFPVLVKLTASNFDFSKAQAAGQDIRFTDSDGTTLLNYEIESWDNSGQTASLWVKVPQIDINSNTDNIYMYYGNGSASDAQNASGVWETTYKSVYHLKEASGTAITDATSNAINGTKLSSIQPTSDSNGQISNAQNFDGTAYISNTRTVLSSGLTYEAWVKTTDTRSGTGTTYVANTVLGDSTGAIYVLFGVNGGKASYDQYVSNYTTPLESTSSVNDGNWHYIAATHNSISGAEKVYVDGALQASGTKSYQTTYNAWDSIGASYGHENKFNGSIDEVRVSSAPRSSAWIAASYSSEKSTFNTYNSQEQYYASSGTLTSAIFDSGGEQDWGNLTYNATIPANTTVSVKVRTGDLANLSDSLPFSSCSGVSSGSDITSSCAPDKSRYAQYQLTLTTTANTTPVLQDIALAYTPSDTTAPPTNASAIAMKASPSGASISSNAWTNANTPYFSWTAGADDGGGSGIKGYCLYLGTDNTADPVTTKGLLGTSPVDTSGACQFAIAGNNIDLSTSGYIGTALATSNSAYYLSVKAIDNANNVYSGSSAQFHFRFDNTPPTNPTFITAPSQFVSSKDVTLTWPTNGADAPADTNSGLVGLQYRIGSGGTWYGDNHNGNQDSTDLLANDGSYETVNTPDFANLSEGNNIVYFRTWDAAGNYSPGYVTTVIKINTSSPSSPQNVTPTPTINTTNSFAFSWLAPASFTGSAANLTYCYTINAIPSGSNCTYTAAGVTSIPAGAYATQPGDNTFYVVAKDEAGNINYATAASATFNANTAAPGVPLNLDIADISVKSTSNWKLALSWEAPTDVGAGVASYKVYRSTNGTSFSQVASTAGTSSVDGGLSQVTYYYKVKACDSANNCGAFTNVVSKLPTGKFTSPATLVSGPAATNVSTKKATVTWATDRDSDSRVAYGTKSGNYNADEISNSSQVSAHTINLTNLSPGTTYYYKAKWTDEDGNIGLSSEFSFTTLPAPGVKDVAATGVTLSSANIQFTSTNATAVKILYGKSADFGGQKLINTSTAESNYSLALTGLDDGAKYFYKLNTFDVDGNEYDSGISFSFQTPARPKISNLRFQPVTDEPTSTQQVSWTTNVPASTQVSFGVLGSAQKDQVDTKLVTDHVMIIQDLLDNSQYSLVASSRDGGGNLATSDTQIFKTALDTRPPKITNIAIDPSIRGTGAEARGQIIVSWHTDEPSTSQVAYAQGSSGPYTNRTSEDATMTFDHVVIVSDLNSSTVYHVQPMSKDTSGNQGLGEDQSTIIGKATDSVLSVIFNALQKIFGLKQ